MTSTIDWRSLFDATCVRSSRSVCHTLTPDPRLVVVVVDGLPGIVQIARQRRTTVEPVVQRIGRRRPARNLGALGDWPRMQHLRDRGSAAAPLLHLRDRIGQGLDVTGDSHEVLRRPPRALSARVRVRPPLASTTYCAGELTPRSSCCWPPSTSWSAWPTSDHRCSPGKPRAPGQEGMTGRSLPKCRGNKISWKVSQVRTALCSDCYATACL